MRRLLSKLRPWPAGRWFVISAALVGGAGVLYQLIAKDEQFDTAFLKGMALTGALFVLLGVGHRLWQGDKMQGAQLPGGGGAQFEPADAAEQTREAIEKLNDRVTTQSEQLIDLQRQLDKRVADLESAVFKDTPAQPEDSA